MVASCGRAESLRCVLIGGSCTVQVKVRLPIEQTRIYWSHLEKNNYPFAAVIKSVIIHFKLEGMFEIGKKSNYRPVTAICERGD